MPQIDQIASTYASQIFWLLITFGLVYFTIGRGMLPKVEQVVDARDRRIADDLVAAERARAAADETEAAWRKRMDEARDAAAHQTAEAKAAAARDAEGRVKAADAEAEARVAAAEARIAAARTESLANIDTVAAEAAQDIVRRLAGIDIDEAAARAAVREVAHG
ncbi:F-type H+-transporting ATPase subunit b [Sphingomonas jejuensis]|uniref:ATP synthase subunit b n=1 Tax=Sphingomonas jejuensis TaxID=904715 RepID=A0ABX0XI58_9SPHN|nr:ATPase [Sphingomonas jejuensis]NJC33014.1 F-type H+-transporting ATPase subunit b [Sphingomonas jejuensis]